MWRRWLSRVAAVGFGLFVASGLIFGAVASTATDPMDYCGDDFNEIGFCPPYNDDTCIDDCIWNFPEGWGGHCEMRTLEIDDCCVCIT